MKIREIRVEGFGGLQNRTVLLHGPMTVLYGPNEAGKSTLLHLIRAVLFGFPSRQSGLERFEPAKGGVHGGSLVLEPAPGERVRVFRRSADAAASGGRGRAPSAGLVTVTLPDGREGGEELLRELLGGVTAEQFRNLFAFTLTELQELHTLTSEELGGFLHSAGLGVRASAVRETEKRLAQELESRFRPKGRSQGIGQLLGEWDTLDAAWRKSLAQAGRYNHLAAEIGALTERIAEAGVKLADGGARLALLEAAAAQRERWLRLRSVTEALGELQTAGAAGFPEDGLARQEALLAELEKRQETLAGLQARQTVLEEAVAAYSLADADLVRQRDRLQALTEELSLYKAGFAQEEELLLELGRLERLLQSKLREAGISRAEEPVGALGEAGIPCAEETVGTLPEADTPHGEPADTWSKPLYNLPPVTLQHREEAARFKELWGERELARVRLDKAVDAAEEELAQAAALTQERRGLLAEAEHELAAAYPPDADGLAAELPAAIRELRREYGQLAEAGREYRHLRERELEHRLSVEQLQAQAEASGRTVSREERQAAGGRLALWALLLGLGGGAGLFFGLDGNWLLAGAGVAAAAAAAGGLLWSGRASPGRGGRSSRRYRPGDEAAAGLAADTPLASRRQELARELEERRGQLARRLQVLESRLGGGGGGLPVLETGNEALPDQLEEWLSRLNQALRERGQLEERWKAAQDGETRLRRQLEQLGRERRRTELEQRELLAEWKEWLAEWNAAGAEVSPEAALDVVALLDQAAELRLRLEEGRARLGRIRQSRAAFEAAAGAVLGRAVGRPEELQLALQAFRKAVELAAERQARCREAETELGELAPRLRLEEDALLRCREKLMQLWRQADAAGEEEFRRLGAREAARLELAEEEATLRELLAAAVGSARLDKLGEVLERCSPAELALETEQLGQELLELEASVDRWKEEKGKLHAEYARLAEGADHGALREKQEELLARFGDEASQWAVFAMAAGLLARTKSRYERDKQPEVMRRASEHFARLTGGRYVQIAAPMGEERMLAIRPGGEAVDSARLSRGTAEQMYLALRFALAAEFARQTPLPLVMDDIFVNFDGERLQLALRELAALSEQHQVLLFTCHRHVLDALAEAAPSAQRIMLPGAADAG
ncbi:AAA family ATPase [Paenibacillus sp. YN15]|uniref:AAA family ATPase n=1 Tax=Paenibacillus sp. YN15 TaxID=1742774 RepID=UPI000DCF0874|nr:AAA family ATPase [Paenibacillus sp. YN15]RAU92097.1 hypothetical protein DQG13_28195 [Paenibacillus sp. YN15]